MKHRYFVSYFFPDRRGIGFGAGEVVLDREIDGWDILMAAMDQCARVEGITGGVTPISWQKFPEETEKATVVEDGQKKSVDLGELKDETKKLLALLEDPQPGTLAWNDFMRERLQKLHALIAPTLGR